MFLFMVKLFIRGICRSVNYLTIFIVTGLFSIAFSETNVWIILCIIVSLLFSLTSILKYSVTSNMTAVENLFKIVLTNDFQNYSEYKFKDYLEAIQKNISNTPYVYEYPDAISGFEKTYLLKVMENPDKIRVFTEQELPSNGPDTSLFSLGTPDGFWVFTTSKPNELENIDCYKLLHEIGHFSITSAKRSSSRNTSIVSILMVTIYIFLAVRVGMDLVGLLLLMSMLTLTVILSVIDKKNEPIHTINDEIYADYFGLIYSDIDWFKNIGSNKLGINLCSMQNFEEKLVKIRVDAFSDILDKLRRREKIPHYYDYYCSQMYDNLKYGLHIVYAIFLYFFSEYYSPSSYIDLVFISVVIFISFFSSVFVIQMFNLLKIILPMTIPGAEINKVKLREMTDLFLKVDKLSSKIPMPELYRKSRFFIFSLMTRLERKLEVGKSVFSIDSILCLLPNLHERIAFTKFYLNYDGKSIFCHVDAPIHNKLVEVTYHATESRLIFAYEDESEYQLGPIEDERLKMNLSDVSTLTIIEDYNSEEKSRTQIPLKIQLKEPALGHNATQSRITKTIINEKMSAVYNLIHDAKPSTESINIAVATLKTYDKDDVINVFLSSSINELAKKPAFSNQLLTLINNF